MRRRLASKCSSCLFVLGACAPIHGTGDPGPAGAEHAGRHRRIMPVEQAMTTDAREFVRFPESMRVHTLANMRDHLAALGEIQQALSAHDFDRAAHVAENRLGMSSLASHGAHDVARHMPASMREAGSAMHRSASRFAATARDASVLGDTRPALAALARLTETCVACHAAFRLQ